MGTIRKTIFTIVFVLFNVLAWCQGRPPVGPPGGGGPPAGPGCDSPMPPPGCPNVPVDANIVVVMFLGLLFALFLLYKRHTDEMATKN